MSLAIKEFHYITPLPNVESIFEKGILSHNEAIKTDVKKDDVSLDAVQKIRATKVISSKLMGQPKVIHDCVNVYLNAHNPMLIVLKPKAENLCVLRLKPDLLTLPNATISDRNAATHAAKFYTVAESVNKIATDVLFSKFWTSRNNSKEKDENNKQVRCAELLLPNTIHPSYIGGIYVPSQAVKDKVIAKFPDGCPVPITINPEFFFLANWSEHVAPLSNKLYPTPVIAPVEEVPTSPKVVIDITRADKTLVTTTIEEVAATILQPVEGPVILAVPEPKVVPAAPVAAAPVVIKREVKGIEKYLIKKPLPAPGAQPVAYSNDLVIPPHIKLLKGENLFHSKMQTLVNTVNCRGVMGAGIALMFKRMHPEMFSEYQKLCNESKVIPGVPYVSKVNPKILNFPTKREWNKPSQMLWVQEGLKLIKANYKEWGITSIAFPALGCGNGKLNWEKVRDLMVRTFKDEVNLTIEIYEPPY